MYSSKKKKKGQSKCIRNKKEEKRKDSRKDDVKTIYKFCMFPL